MSPTTLRKLRNRSGLSQQGLARRLGVTRTTVTRWENGTRRPSKIAELAVQTVVAGRDSNAWERLASRALNELWDNPEDAVYDAWQEHYHASTR